ncbi:MAG: UvrD-helicase domain-containing protein, partial [Myxococcales bacterium]|nr:UvrD-helicase domain-containing protein [Myxococcales bacterium]
MIADDSRARARIESELDATFLVEAAAGTGKTTCLVSRLVALIGAGADMQSVVAVTFTDKAAGELRLRLRSGLEEAKLRAEGPRREAFNRALSGLEQARVSTIHRFASDLLRERPIEAGIDPAFVPCPPAEQRGLIAEAFGRWLERVESDPSPALRRYFARPSASVYALRSAAERVIEHRHLDAAWARRPIDLEAEMRAVLTQARALAARARAAQSKSDKLYVSLLPLLSLDARLERHEVREQDGEADLVELSRASLGRDRGYGRYGEGVDRAELFAEVADFKKALDAFVARASADLAVSLRDELWQVAILYRELKAKRGALDFDDLLILARDLFLREGPLLTQTRARLRHYFVDEFQDTDSSQAALLLLLSSDSPPGPDPLALDIAPGKLFLVGDPKQSIYRFRQADPGTYFLMRERVIECGGEVLHLNASFRSAPAIVGYVNAAFTPVMAGDREAEQAEYVALAPRCPESDDPAVFALAVPRPYGKQRLSKAAVRKSHPDTVAGFLAWLIEKSGYRVRDPRSGERVPVRPEHVAVLFRQFESYGEHRPEAFSRGLSQHGIPHVVLGGRALGDRDESHALVTALSAIEYPDDPLLVYGALRGPLFGFTDELLYRWHLTHHGLRPLVMPKGPWTEALAPVGDALNQLGRLHVGRNRVSPAETLADLLSVTRAPVGFALSPAAEQAFLQIGALEQLAMAHERAGGLSFRSFVDSLAEMSLERGADAEDLDEDMGGVRLLTVYRAKGLEFPVVVLADPSISAFRDPDKLIDAKRGLASLTLAG